MLTQKQIEEMDKLTGLGSSNSQSRIAELDSLASSTPTTQSRSGFSLGEKVLDFTGGKEIAQGLGQAIAQPRIAKELEKTQTQQIDIQTQLLDRIKQNKEQGKDTSRLENALAMITEEIGATGEGAKELLNPNQLTDKKVLGDALQLGATIGTIGGLSGAGTSRTLLGKNIPGLTTQGTGAITNFADKITKGGVGVLSGGAKGSIIGGITGTTSGALQGTAQALQNDTSVGKGALTGGLVGGIGGGLLGGFAGAISGGLKGRALRQAVLDDKANAGFTLAQIDKKTLDLAKQQGFDETDIQFVRSMNKNDKANAQKMINLAKASTTDKRIIERPIDIVGDNMMNRIKFIEGQNKKAGLAVNQVAKSLKGQPVNADNILQKSQEVLDDLNITLRPDGKLNFDNSVFKNTPQLQKKLEKFFTQIPRGQADAYDVHIFKKSIDELVDYGVQGEGLKGNSERVLKMLRASADDVLDQTFDAYNQANTDFRNTRMVLDEARDLFGKKAGFSKEKGGQLLRSVFSNNNQRPRVLKLVDDLDKTSKLYGKEFKDSLVDQAIFTEILEDIYGTQATTSLQGQVARAVKGTQRVIEGIRDPIKGTGDLLATGTEKLIGVSDENKKKVLEALIR